MENKTAAQILDEWIPIQNSEQERCILIAMEQYKNQEIRLLTELVEHLKQSITDYYGEKTNLQIDVSRLREERKELVEAERSELIEALEVRLAVAGSSTESESNFLQRMLNSLKTK